MQLSKALRLSNSDVVAFVGAGGKTSAMFRVAQELAPALVTTTTHLGAWQASLANLHFIWAADAPMPEIESWLSSGVILVTGMLDEETGRFRRLDSAQLKKLRELAGYHNLPLLIEADGSRQKPLKAPAPHEPVIPAFADVVVVVAGLSALKQPLHTAIVHRSEIFSRLSGLKEGEAITPQALAKVLTSTEGGLKNIPAGARRVALLNQADTPALQAQANEIDGLLLQAYDAVVISSMEPPPGSPPEIVSAVKEKIGGIILAAGAASRYGQPKQLLDYHGQPFVRVVAETALQAGLEPVILVSGANADLVEAAVDGLPVIVSRNPDWQVGQSTSMRTGVTALKEQASQAGGAIFLLVDQPQVNADVLRALVERHSQDLPAAVAPYVFDQRANPVLFDRVTFDDLLTLQGDTGGRAGFSKFSPRYVNWYDRGLLLDVDTPEDYDKLLRGEF